MPVYNIKPQDVKGGGSSKTEIVDALPADGVEGQIYLLRKAEENSIFKVHCYNMTISQGSTTKKQVF